VLLAGGTGAWLAIAADEGLLPRANATSAGAAALLLAIGLALRVTVAIPVAIALLGAEYVALLGFEGGALDARAPLVAGALLAVAELGYWSLELRTGVADEPGTYLRRIALLAALLLGVIGAGVVMLSLVEAVSAGGAAFDVLGALAAVGALVLVALAARATAP
jgi:hypothetical protein